jgi:hypothetical protein
MKEKFNSILIILYPTGQAYVDYHQDDEKEITKESSIVIVSLGATRKFGVQDLQRKQLKEIVLHTNSILVMKGDFQKYYYHSLLKDEAMNSPRISFTFRNISKSTTTTNNINNNNNNNNNINNNINNINSKKAYTKE